MARLVASVRERTRTYEGCRDLYQTQSVPVAVSGCRQAPREREPPSFGPLQEGLRICFETLENREEPGGNRASRDHLLRRNIPLCVAAWHLQGRSQVRGRVGNPGQNARSGFMAKA